MNNVRAKESVHKAVLLNEVVDLLVTKWEEKTAQKSVSAKKLESNESASAQKSASTTIPTYLDGTLGGAGHALAVAKALGGKLNIIGLDRDETALKRAEQTLDGHCKTLILKNENFRNLEKVLADVEVSEKTPSKKKISGATTVSTTARVDMILLDLGISSDELDNSNKGFTFQKDEPLYMTMGEPEQYPFTANDIVNKWDEEVIANIIFGYAEEKFARRIARAIVSYRMKKQIETTMELAELIKLSVPGFYRRGRIHPATKTFQALRIAVNDELGALKEGLKKGYEVLNKGGRFAVISFHSLEDRIVKEFFREKLNDEAIIITKKPVIALEQEKIENPRSRSAKLRVLEKTK